MTQQDSSSDKQKIPYLTNSQVWLTNGRGLSKNKKQEWKWKQRMKDSNILFASFYGAEKNVLMKLAQDRMK